MTETTSAAQTAPINTGGAHRDNEPEQLDPRQVNGSVPDQPDSSPDDGGVPVVTVVLFLIGTALLVAAAASLTHMSSWADRWGQIPVFLVFFLIMSIAGRWFWAGADAIISAIKDKE